MEIEFFADDGELVVLDLLKGLLLVKVEDDTGGINHAWAKEPKVRVRLKST